jgi:flagellar motor switch protein FliG
MEHLDGRRKAAILLASLGPEQASQIMGKLSEEEVEQMTLDLSSLGNVEPEVRDAVLAEFHEMAVGKKFLTHGGIDYARNLLEQSFGAERAFEILNRLQTSLQEVPFQFLKKADAAQISSFIQDEHPQTISLILAHMPPQTAALVISALPQHVQAEVAMRIATMDRTPPEIVREVERVLERKMAAVYSQGFTFAGGV